MTPIQTSIVKTLSYADIFDYPLTTIEIHQYFIHQKKTSLNTIKKALPQLVKQKKVQSNHPYYFLPKRSALINKRKQRAKHSSKKKATAQKIAHSLAQISSIQAIFLTGALAMNNARQGDDIDFMIVASSGQLWTARIQTTIKLQSQGIRRTPTTKNTQDLICANMYLDTSDLSVPKKKQNLYTAHEVIQVKPLIDKNHIHDHFLSQNKWISQHLPHTLIPTTSQADLATQPTTPIARITEKLAYQLQYWYMHQKITSETITKNSAFFHPRDTSKIVLNKYTSRLQKNL